MKALKYRKDCEHEKIYTTRTYTVVNVGCGKVTLEPNDKDKFDNVQGNYSVEAGEKVTIRNYRNVYYVVA